MAVWHFSVHSLRFDVAFALLCHRQSTWKLSINVVDLEWLCLHLFCPAKWPLIAFFVSYSNENFVTLSQLTSIARFLTYIIMNYNVNLIVLVFFFNQFPIIAFAILRHCQSSFKWRNKVSWMSNGSDCIFPMTYISLSSNKFTVPVAASDSQEGTPSCEESSAVCILRHYKAYALDIFPNLLSWSVVCCYAFPLHCLRLFFTTFITFLINLCHDRNSPSWRVYCNFPSQEAMGSAQPMPPYQQRLEITERWLQIYGLLLNDIRRNKRCVWSHHDSIRSIDERCSWGKASAPQWPP